MQSNQDNVAELAYAPVLETGKTARKGSRVGSNPTVVMWGSGGVETKDYALHVRVPGEWRERVLALLEKERAGLGYCEKTEATVWRCVMLRGLEDVERLTAMGVRP